MKKSVFFALVAVLPVIATAQPNVQRAIAALDGSPWVDKYAESSFASPKDGTLLRRNREWRLSLPLQQVDSMVLAFEHDCAYAYTYVLTSADYNRRALPQRNIEMRLQNDMRLSASALDYSYALLNVIDTADTRFRTTYIFQWWQQQDGNRNLQARLYILYGLRPSTATAKAGKGATRASIPYRASNLPFSTFNSQFPTVDSREMLERDPLTGLLQSYNSSMSFAGSSVATSIEHRLNSKPAYSKQVSRSEHPKQTSARFTFLAKDRSDGRYRTAYILQTSDDATELHTVYGEMGYDEIVTSDTVFSAGSKLLIANIRAQGGYLSANGLGAVVLTHTPTLVTVNPSRHGYMLLIGGRAIADDKGGKAQLVTRAADSNDPAQAWLFVRQANGWNLINCATRRTMNLANGNTAEGAPIIGYNTDQRNATSANRLWTVIAVK